MGYNESKRMTRPSILSHHQSGFTIADLIAVLGILSVIGLGMMIYFDSVTRKNSNQKVQCAGNLKHIGNLASMYAENLGSDYFPFGEGDHPPAHDSLNPMVRFYKTAKKINPALFICPKWSEGEKASVDPKTHTYQLTSRTNSYAWTASKLSVTDAGQALASDKFIKDDYVESDKKKAMSGHRMGMNVLYTDMSVQWMLIEQIKEADNDGLPKGLTR